jgi:3-oxoacyl-[acyl-carrier-protein] synthase II
LSQPPRRRIVITGLGVVSPNGLGAPAFSQALASGASGLGRLQDFLPHCSVSPPLRTSAVAAVDNFNPATVMDASELRRVPRLIPMALAASHEALAMSRLAIDPQDIEIQRQIGVALGTGGGGLAFVEEQYRQFFLDGKGSLFSITAGTHGNLSSELSITLHLRGPSHVISTGCASSTDALGYAAMLIRHGIVPMMLAGGADAPIAPGILTTFERMRVISTRRWDHPAQASRPFSLDRDGFVLGEGAWMFILEDLDHATHRGAPILAEFLGYASTCDAYHRVQIAPELDEPVRAIELALRDANVAKDDIGYINLHGTGTDLNDRLETAAIKKCFGPRATRIPCSSTKSMIGHPQGACGAAGLAATILSLRSGFLHPTINLDIPDPACDLDYIPHTARQAHVDLALCNCIAFGSKNSALIVRKM